MIRSHVQHVAIIGGGFSGTLTAINLARLSTAPLRISLINCAYPAGRGIAYSTRRAEHLLNVAARNMSALPEYPSHFVDWLLTRTEYANIPEAELRETFMPRRVYGDYLRSLAWHYSGPLNSHSNVEIKTISGEVVDLITETQGARLLLADGTTLLADRVVLATGNEPPADLPGAVGLSDHPAWCANPWIDWETKLPAAGGTIVLLGTGLTTVDAILTLLTLDWRGPIHAVSRHGLLPQSHFKGVDVPDFPPPDVDLASLRLTELVALMEKHCERLRRSGANPAIIVDKLRPHTQRIWQGFSDQERQEFITRYSARWHVIRHRIAPSLADASRSPPPALPASAPLAIKSPSTSNPLTEPRRASPPISSSTAPVRRPASAPRGRPCYALCLKAVSLKPMLPTWVSKSPLILR